MLTIKCGDLSRRIEMASRAPDPIGRVLTSLIDWMPDTDSPHGQINLPQIHFRP